MKEVMRQADQDFVRVLNKIRVGNVDDEVCATLRSRCISDDETIEDALYLFSSNEKVRQMNERKLRDLPGDLVTFNAVDRRRGGHAPSLPFDFTSSENYHETGNLATSLKLKVGARVQLTQNLDISDGLCNGALGKVISMIERKGVTGRNKFCVLVEFDNPRVGKERRLSSPFKEKFPNAVPIFLSETSYTPKNRKGFEITRLQLPLILAWGLTIHKAQGLTVDKVVLDMDGRFSAGQAYVGISRVRSLEGLFITNFDKRKIRHQPAFLTEMERLRGHTPQSCDPRVQIRSFDGMSIIACLNVRGLRSKLLDLLHDDIVQKAQVLVLTETHLCGADHEPFSAAGFVTFRSDRGKGEGGVLLAVRQSLEPVFIHSGPLDQSKVEIVTVKVRVNAVEFLLTGLYKSPDVKFELFAGKVERHDTMARRHSQVSRSLLLGDFNIDDTEGKATRLRDRLSKLGYQQLVRTPTFVDGSVLDHIYADQITSRDLETVVLDCYYSDHQWIVSALR